MGCRTRTRLPGLERVTAGRRDALTIYVLGILLDGLQQALSLLECHLAGLLARIAFPGLRLLLFGLLLTVLLLVPLLRLTLLVLLFVLLILVLLTVTLLLFLLLFLLLHLLEDPLEVVFGIDVGWSHAESLLVCLEALLELLLAIEGVAQVVPGRTRKRRVSGLDSALVRLDGPLIVPTLIERVPVIEAD
jgi:hypothetical protein